jgi:hypothetical protein
LAAPRLDLSSERFQRFLPALLRRQFERGIASIVRQRQHFGKERRLFAWCKLLRQEGIEFVEFCDRRIVVRKSGSAFQLPGDHRIQRAIGALRGAKIAQSRVRFTREAFQECRRKPRFADAGLAGDQHYLAFASLCLRPAPKKKFEFLFASDKFSQRASVQSLEAAWH